MTALTVGEKVLVKMPGLKIDQRVGVLIEIMQGGIGKVRFGDGREVLIPMSKLR